MAIARDTNREIKQRAYDLALELLGNYETVLGEVKCLQHVIDGDYEECQVSVPFSESPHRVL